MFYINPSLFTTVIAQNQIKIIMLYTVATAQ